MEEMQQISKGDLTAANKAMTRARKKKKEFALNIKRSSSMWQRERISLENCTTDSIQTELQ